MFTCTVRPARSAVQAFLRPTAAVQASRPMPIDVIETNDAYVLHAELPGIPRADIEVEVEKQQVRIVATRAAQENGEGTVLLRERGIGRWERSFELPLVVDAERAQAVYADGVLELRLPKLQAEPNRRITVN